MLAASSSGIAPVSAYGVAARPTQADQILFAQLGLFVEFFKKKTSNTLNVQNDDKVWNAK